MLLLAAFLSTYSFVDIEAVRATGAPASFVRTANIPANLASENCEILIAGAGMGGKPCQQRGRHSDRQQHGQPCIDAVQHATTPSRMRRRLRRPGER